jgi:hypothetical protein
MRKLAFILSFFGTYLGLRGQIIKVKDVRQEGQNLVVFYDNLSGNGKYDISLFYSPDDGNNWAGPLKFVNGDVGKGISSGSSKCIIWSVLNEQSSLVGDKVRVKVVGLKENNEDVVLDMLGWKFDRKPTVTDESSEEGKVVFQVKVDEEGNIISVNILQKDVSPALARKYQKEVETLSFSRTSGVKTDEGATGKITFFIRKANNDFFADSLSEGNSSERLGNPSFGVPKCKIVSISVKCNSQGLIPVDKKLKDDFEEAGNNYDYRLYLFEDPVLRNLVLYQIGLKDLANIPLPNLKSALAKKLKRYAAEEKSIDYFQHTIIMDYELLNDSLVSFYNVLYDNLGGAHGFFNHVNFVINTKVRRVQKIRDFIPDTSLLKERLYPYFILEGSKPKYQGLLDNYSNASELPFPKSVKIVGRKLYAHFPEYSVGPYAVGNVDVFIPKSALKGVLEKDLYSCLSD